MSVHRIAAVVTDYIERFPDELRSLSDLLDMIAAGDDFTSRSHFRGHITASGILIIGAAPDTILIKHKKLWKWLFPGGHCEPDEMPFEAALREIREETGVLASLYESALLPPRTPVDIDVHVIPANPKNGEPLHTHYDFRYLLSPLSDTTAPAIAANEVDDIQRLPLVSALKLCGSSRLSSKIDRLLHPLDVDHVAVQ